MKRALTTLVSGTVIAQLIGVAASPVLTRLYSPEQFGALAIVTSVAAVLSVALAGRYEMAIMLPSERREADAIALLACFLAICGAVVLAVVAVVWGHLIGELPESARLSSWMPWIVVLALLLSLCKTSSQSSAREREFRVLSASKIAQTLAAALIATSIGAAPAGSEGLIYGAIAGQAMALVILLVFSSQAWLRFPDATWLREMLVQARRYGRFPKISMWGALCDTLALQVPVFAIARVFSVTDAGYFNLSFRVLSLPLAVVGSALSQVFFERVARMRREQPDAVPRFLIRSAGTLALCIVPFVVVFVGWGESVFAWAFGDEWSEAGKYAAVLVLSIAIKFVASPLSPILLLDKGVRAGAAWQVAYLLTLTTVLMLASSLDMRDFLLVFVAHEIVMYAVYLGLILSAGRKLSRCAE